MISNQHKLPYRAAHVANFILENAEKDNVPDMSILKLLKLVYIFFGWISAFHKGDELYPDPIEAWQYGPVVPSIYYDFRRFGRNPIPKGERAVLYSLKDDLEIISKPTEDVFSSNQGLSSSLEILWNAYKTASAEHLVSMTHEKDTPWWKTYDGTRNKEIPKKLIAEYYRKLYEY